MLYVDCMGHGVLQCGYRNLSLHITAPCTMPFAPCDKTLHGAQYERWLIICRSQVSSLRAAYVAARQSPTNRFQLNGR